MLQVPAAETAAEGAHEGFNASEVIIEHVSNSSIDHPLIHLPTVLGIDLSVTKHVLMLWVVAGLLFLVVTAVVRKYLRQDQRVPSGLMNGLEFVVEFIRDSVVEPNVGRKWVNFYTPLLLTFFLFILTANLIGLIPIFDVLSLANRALAVSPESFLGRVVHGGTTVTGNYNVTAGLATITFVAIIVAGVRAHGFVQHWVNMVPKGLPIPIYVILIPIEILGMFVRPFALTMRLAANMTGGHIALLAVMSLVFIFNGLSGAAAGIGAGVVGLPVTVGISALEIIVILVQAYVFTLLSAVFIGMAIHAHH